MRTYKIYFLWKSLRNATYGPRCISFRLDLPLPTHLHFYELPCIACILHPHISLRVLLLFHSIRACVPGSPTQDTLVERRKLARLLCRIQNIQVADQIDVRDAPPTMFQGFFIVQGHQFTLTGSPPLPQPEKAWICH